MLPVFLKKLETLKRFQKKEWFSVLFISLGGSVLAMYFFTKAFALATNYNIPILLQKLQPLIAISLAYVFLKETLNRSFLFLAAIAILGAYLISFGDLQAFSSLHKARASTVIFSLLATFIWGTCTVASRHLLTQHSYLTVTSLRYVFAFFALITFSMFSGEIHNFSQITINDLKLFSAMALVPGMLALLIYYHGVQSTKASLATICELSFPLGAIFINWFFLDSKLSFHQFLGTLLLVISITWMSLNSSLKRSSP